MVLNFNVWYSFSAINPYRCMGFVILHSPLIIYFNGVQSLCRGLQGHREENKDKMVKLLCDDPFYEVSMPERAKAGVGRERGSRRF